MESPEQIILKALKYGKDDDTASKAKKDDEIKRMIKENPKLVNMTIEKIDHSLMNMLFFGNKSPELIEVFVKHPDFNFNFVNKDGFTNLETIFQYGRKDVLISIIDKPEILHHKDKLTYEIAKNQLNLIETALATKKLKTPNAATIQTDELKITNLKEMISLLALATIKLAYTTKNSAVIIQLKIAGCDLTEVSATTTDKELVDWLKKYIPSEQKSNSANQSARDFMLFKDSKKEIDALTQKHQESQKEIIEQSTVQREKRMGFIQSLFKNTKSSSDKPSNPTTPKP